MPHGLIADHVTSGATVSMTAAGNCSNKRAIQRFRMGPFAADHAGTRLNEASSATLQARGWGFESPWLHLFPLVRPTFQTSRPSELRALAAANCSSWPLADLCLITTDPLGQATDELAARYVSIEEGPVERTGATGRIPQRLLPQP